MEPSLKKAPFAKKIVFVVVISLVDLVFSLAISPTREILVFGFHKFGNVVLVSTKTIA